MHELTSFYSYKNQEIIIICFDLKSQQSFSLKEPPISSKCVVTMKHIIFCLPLVTTISFSASDITCMSKKKPGVVLSKHLSAI